MPCIGDHVQFRNFVWSSLVPEISSLGDGRHKSLCLASDTKLSCIIEAHSYPADRTGHWTEFSFQKYQQSV